MEAKYLDLPEIFVWSAAATFVFLMPLIAVLRRAGVIDRPNSRSSHITPTVRGGGLGIVVVLLLSTLAIGRTLSGFFPGFALPVMVLASVSFADDLRSISVRIRLAVQFIVSGCALCWLEIECQMVGLSSPLHASVFLGFSVCWMVGYTNAFNFMDGINGLAAAQAMICGIGSIGLALSAGLGKSHPAVLFAASLAGASAGFIPYNFPRARVFMGDVGSATLGFALAFVCVWMASTSGLRLLIPLLFLHANFILDTAITLVRRLARGDKLYLAHREHFYQRLSRSGWSHTRVTALEVLMQCVAAAMLIWASGRSPETLYMVCTIVTAMWIGLFTFAERSFNRSNPE